MAIIRDLLNDDNKINGIFSSAVNTVVSRKNIRLIDLNGNVEPDDFDSFTTLNTGNDRRDSDAKPNTGMTDVFDFTSKNLTTFV